jgi:phosphoglycolate phosphatase
VTSVKAVIFDLDGTLIDSAPDIAAAVNRYLFENGWPEQDVDFIERFIGYGPRKLLVDVFEVIGHPKDDAAVKAAHEAYLSNYRDAPAERTRFYPHVREDLEALRAAGLRLGICTNKPHELTGKVLDAVGIAPLFEVAIGADAVPACKPDPGHLVAVAKAMGLETHEFAYVGDTVVDQNTAQAAGAAFFCVPWGGGSGLEVNASQRLTRLADISDRLNVPEKAL